MEKSNNINLAADSMLQKITTVIREENKHNVKIESAIISAVNTDGTYDIYIPPDEKNHFTHILNQTSFELQVGDSVELMLKNGSYSNCWIIAKHGTSYTNEITALTNIVNDLTNRLEKIEQIILNSSQE